MKSLPPVILAQIKLHANTHNLPLKKSIEIAKMRHLWLDKSTKRSKK